MLKKTCIIIEDEFPATTLLKAYIEKYPEWNLSAEFTNAIDALVYLKENTVDLIFLDIELPQLSGLNFIKALDKPPLIIITSAYNEHAVEAFELMVFDYLLKPFSFERFVKSISRVDKKLEEINENKNSVSDSISIISNREHVSILKSSIIYIESQKEYVLIVCEERRYKTKFGIGKMEELLDSINFIRVHRSFIISKPYIDSYSASYIKMNDQQIPIGRLYKKEVLRALKVN